MQPFLPNKQQYKGIPGRNVLKTITLKCKRNLFGPLSSQKPKNKVESAKVKTDCRLYFSLLFSKGSVAIYRLRGGGIFGDQMDYRGNDGRSSGRQQSKKRGV